MSRGRFVVLEGGDGSGKTTQARMLSTWLRAQGVDVVETFEPGAGPTGAVLREVLLHGDEAITPAAEALLMAADRAQHVAHQIEPALERGQWVVCDRYVPSSLVYQGVVRDLGVDVVEQLSEVATAGLAPDVVVVLDVSDAVAETRRGADADRLEREGDGFHARVRAAYRKLAAERGWMCIDADREVEHIAREVRATVAPWLAR